MWKMEIEKKYEGSRYFPKIFEQDDSSMYLHICGIQKRNDCKIVH